MKRWVWVAAILIPLAGVLFLLLSQGEAYSVSADGFLAYAGRAAPEYSQTLLLKEGGWSLYKIAFKSRDSKIYGLLSVPDSAAERAGGQEARVGAFILLGGNTVTKEGIQERLGKDLNSLGFATLSLDQRGEGETGGRVPSMQDDYQTFLRGGEPVQHLMVRDALAAYDLLRGRNGIDPERIYVAGESMGGRIAAIAAGIEPGIAGDVLISTSGYEFTLSPDQKLNRFLRSVSPDTYIGRISPRPVVFIHSRNDPVVPYDMGRKLFEKAGEPKRFFTADVAEHSYIPEAMKGFLEQGVKGW